MKILVPSAIALAMLLGVGSASACDFHQMTMASVAPAQPAASAKLKQMVMTYLREIADEHRIA
jgi:hypothetical protein